MQEMNFRSILFYFILLSFTLDGTHTKIHDGPAETMVEEILLNFKMIL